MDEQLQHKIQFEIDELDRLLSIYADLISRASGEPTDLIETTALATVLHTFYTGIERIFVAIARFHDGVLPDGEYWHRKLLDQMAQPQPSRPPVITDALVVQLREYLGFRHFFRNAYTFYLDWSRLQPLAENIVPTWTVLKQALNEFRKANYDTP